jgi:predicted transcriptional regulator of viral defense system
MPVDQVQTPRGFVRFSTPEITALELLGYPNHAGGVSRVADVLVDLAEEMDPGRLAAAARLSPVSWAQRLGYLLELMGRDELAEALMPLVDARAISYTPLRRKAGSAGPRDSSWKVIINVRIAPES